MSTGVADVLDLIEILARQREPASLSALAKLSGKPKSSCHRLLTILAERGHVERTSEQRYRLLAPVGLGLAPAQARLATIARPLLQSAADRSGVSAYLGVLMGLERLRYVAKALPTGQELVYDRDVARDRDPRIVASGACLLHAGGVEDAIPEDMMELRPAGIVINLNGVVEGAAGVAAPVMDDDGKAVAAVNLAGPKTNFAGNKLDGIIEVCCQAAEAVSARYREGMRAAG